MENKEINITYGEALDILLQIPEDKFIVGAYESLKGECCSIGHLFNQLFNNPIPRRNINNINSVLLHEINIYVKPVSPALCLISQINDGRSMDYYHWRYRQKTPKQRVLAYLLDVIKKGKEETLLINYD